MSELTLIQEQLQELLAHKRSLEKSLQEKQEQIDILNQKNSRHIEQLQTKDGELRACRERVGELNERLDSSQKILAMGNLATGISGRMDSSVAFLRGNISSIQHHFLALDQVLKMPRGGVLTLRLGNQNSMVWIDLVDTGSGIAEHNREKVFNMFFCIKKF